MNWRSARFLVPLLIVCVVLLVCIGGVVVYLHSRTSANITIIWQAHTTTFTQQDQQNIQTTFNSGLIASNGDRIAGHEFTIIDAQRQDDWAIFSSNERVSHDAPPIATEPLFFLAHQQGVFTPMGTRATCYSRTLPDTSSVSHFATPKTIPFATETRPLTPHCILI